MVIEFEHGQFIPDKGYWCEFCQTIHSSRSCYHPAYSRMKILEQQNAEKLVALKVARQLLEGTCQHGYDTSRSARGCDECADQIENAIFEAS